MERKREGLGGLSGPVGITLFNFCCGVYTLCFFGVSVSLQMCLGVCVLFQKDGGRRVLSFGRI